MDVPVDLRVIGRFVGTKISPQEIAAHQQRQQHDQCDEARAVPLGLSYDALRRSFCLYVLGQCVGHFYFTSINLLMPYSVKPSARARAAFARLWLYDAEI